MTENTDDDFTVDAPQEWDVEELTLGDIITNDMWNPNTTKGKHFFDYIAPKDSGWEIISIDDDQEDDDRVYVTVMGVDSKIDFSDWLDKFNDYLKPQYKVYRSINESDDEFTVDAPQEWDMGEYQGTTEDEFKDWIEKTLSKHGNDKSTIKAYLLWLYHFGPYDDYEGTTEQELLNDFEEFKIEILNESDDEFTVDAPEEWNVTELKTGDFIDKSMFQSMWEDLEDFFDYNDGKLKIKVMIFHGEPLVDFFDNEGGYVDTGDLELLNQIYLKPSFQISPEGAKPYDPKNTITLDEQDDEFTVNAPEEWNVQTLGVGDFLTPENSNTGRYYKITKIEGDRVFVRKGDMLRRNSGDIFVPDTPRDVYIYKNALQTKLKPGYELDLDTINESDDDFDVEIGPWDNFSPEYQELEDKFGPQTAGKMRDNFKNTFDSPTDLLKMLNNKSEVWFEIFADAIEEGEDIDDAMSMADMVAQDQEDIDRGVDLAQDILSRPNWKFTGEDTWSNARQLWNQMNEEDNDYYNDMDTSPRENLYDRLMDMIEDLDS